MTEAQIKVRLRARAGEDQLTGFRDGVLLVRVTAPPIDGRANQALCKLIARELRIAPSKVTVVRGERSRDKVVQVEGIDPGALRDALSTPT